MINENFMDFSLRKIGQKAAGLPAQFPIQRLQLAYNVIKGLAAAFTKVLKRLAIIFSCNNHGIDGNLSQERQLLFIG